MKALLQRVSEAGVSIGGQSVAEIGPGLLILICALPNDGAEQIDFLARKIANLRIFEDDGGKMNHSLLDIGGAALVVSQFTLAADLRRGNRPGFSGAAAPDLARQLYEEFCRRLAEHGVSVQTGEFAAQMAVRLVNDGPVTIWLDTDAP
ncbi:MAG: D-aminoacyl-tRNA deacylase [Alphaproteobacteria bacterium]|jgi:D-tyrosyl-tRNA(Tyr) deacylase|nr:D-aminoacyl-tRNA deacylase [Alphaproteobacteria bacterium]MDP6813090.1 D-aminoacyl-tRNA deacylase [Alphaproteobacteria bacterium]